MGEDAQLPGELLSLCKKWEDDLHQGSGGQEAGLPELQGAFGHAVEQVLHPRAVEVDDRRRGSHDAVRCQALRSSWKGATVRRWGVSSCQCKKQGVVTGLHSFGLCTTRSSVMAHHVLQ